MNDPGSQTISVEEAARRLGIGRSLAYELARAGRLPVLHLGAKRMVVPEAALERLLSEGNAKPEPEAERG